MSHRPWFAALSLLALTASPAALACGGFFCSQQPIDQSKERIVFGVDEEAGTVEAHVQIFYQGSAEEFAWIVPVPAVPELGVSIDALFQNLEYQTAPSFYLNWRSIGDCQMFYPPMEDDAVDEDSGGGGVNIIAQSQVGPYDTVTLQATSEAELLGWLQDNSYFIPDAVGDYLAPYVADGSYFIALKLRRDKDVGDIAPIRFTYEATAASIPLVLTAIAATPDMRLQPYVFATHRAVPDNFLHVTVNEAAVDWLGNGSNYDAVITQAANEAGGQAFATDFSGSTTPFRDQLWREGQYDTDLLRATTEPAAFVNAMLGMGFPRTPQVQNLIRAWIPMPQAALDAGIDEQSFYNCLDCYPEYTALIDFDNEGFTDELVSTILTPLRDAERLYYDFPNVTRLTSSMSADEMTSDPLFVQNPDLGDVANVHQADLVVDCTAYPEAPEKWVSWIELADGREILLPPGTVTNMYGGTMPVDADLGGVAAQTVEDAGASGQPTTVQDNSEAAQAGIDAHNLAVQAEYDALGLDVPNQVIDTPTDCGCQHTGPGWAGGLAAAMAALLVRRRR